MKETTVPKVYFTNQFTNQNKQNLFRVKHSISLCGCFMYWVLQLNKVILPIIIILFKQVLKMKSLKNKPQVTYHAPHVIDLLCLPITAATRFEIWNYHLDLKTWTFVWLRNLIFTDKISKINMLTFVITLYLPLYNIKVPRK